MIDYVRGDRILDVGCAGHVPKLSSPYWLHGQLQENHLFMVGIDISEANVAKLRKMGFDDLHVASAEDFDLAQEFDTVVARELIEHLVNPKKFLERARTHLAVEGRLVLTTPYPFSMLHSLYAFFKFPKTCSNDEHTCWLCSRTITAIANRYMYCVLTLEQIKDYESDSASLPYPIFVGIIQVLGWLIPKRLRCNSILAILEPAADTHQGLRTSSAGT